LKSRRVRVWFESSHVGGDLSSGELSVRITREDSVRGITRVNRISFSVPPDFHTHNDSVAAALMTLVGKTFPVVAFNFPISEHCATTLRRYYRLEDIGPLDPELEPRRPGRYLGLMLSGGTDSMAVWLVLKRVLGDDFKVITSEFGREFAFEARGFQHFQRDVSCSTDFRPQGFARSGRFTTAVPLLFADYADLAAVTTGHHFPHVPLAIESLRDGNPPPVLAEEDMVVQAGGLGELHLVRGLNTSALLMLAMLADPEMLAAAWLGSATHGMAKHYHKGLIFQHLFRSRNLAFPEWLRSVSPPRRKEAFADGITVRFTLLYVARHFGLDAVRQEIHDIERYDLSFLDTLDMTFMERYNTNLSRLIPAEMRVGVLAVFHEAGIAPYTERDWAELDEARTYCLAARNAGV
jgi:hypothetical protein